jgi:O-methyltransferase
MNLPDLTETSKIVLPNIVGFSSQKTIQITYQVARLAIQAEGCFAECGVATGGGAAPMGLALMELEDPRPLHLFDSFEGLPHCGIEDHGQIGHEQGNYFIDPNLPLRERLKPTGISKGTEQQIRENFKKWGVNNVNLHFHKGWFQDTLPTANIGEIAFLRLDGDLYESTMCCLECLYPQVSVGGYVWLDEFGMPHDLGGHKAFYDYFQKNPQFKKPVLAAPTDTGASYWQKL